MSIFSKTDQRHNDVSPLSVQAREGVKLNVLQTMIEQFDLCESGNYLER